MKTRCRRLLAILAAISLAPVVLAQTTPEELDRIKPLKGFIRKIAGENIDYNCFNPLARTALLTKGPRSMYRSSPFGERGERIETVRLPANGTATVKIE